jgi:soluble lytic murein transglycosylase-like protein
MGMEINKKFINTKIINKKIIIFFKQLKKFRKKALKFLTKKRRIKMKKINFNKKTNVKIKYLAFIIIALLVSVFLNFKYTEKSNFYENAIVQKDLRIDSFIKKEIKRKMTQVKVSKIIFKADVYSKKLPRVDNILDVVFDKSRNTPFSPYLLMSIIQTESNFNPFAKSSADCLGLMQINHKVWQKKLKIDMTRIYDIEYNIDLGIKVLTHYYELEGKDINKALFRYNNGFIYNNQKYVPKVFNSFISQK